ncbi:hypothetical protein CEXT_309911 [Caerostris extrusa]|uniref:Uncharacterized protein n=1 Tax=Caerostris extrusa TaxID=172846 RepID=A0AAV4UGF8_CAEEX|nr:hypothetical protein CEXT_309911 [Caerostris extrusa]
MTRDIYETDYYRKGGKGYVHLSADGSRMLAKMVYLVLQSDIWYAIIMELCWARTPRPDQLYRANWTCCFQTSTKTISVKCPSISLFDKRAPSRLIVTLPLPPLL